MMYERMAEKVEKVSGCMLVVLGLAVFGGAVFVIAYLAHFGWDLGGR